MYVTKDKKVHIKVCLTLTFEFNCQFQVMVFFYIFYLEKVRINSNIFFVQYIQLDILKVMWYIFIALGLKANRQGQQIYFSISDHTPLKC